MTVLIIIIISCLAMLMTGEFWFCFLFISAAPQQASNKPGGTGGLERGLTLTTFTTLGGSDERSGLI